MRDRLRPGLVTFYDTWPGNGAGLFLQPMSLHRAIVEKSTRTAMCDTWRHWCIGHHRHMIKTDFLSAQTGLKSRPLIAKRCFQLYMKLRPYGAIEILLWWLLLWHRSKSNHASQIDKHRAYTFQCRIQQTVGKITRRMHHKNLQVTRANPSNGNTIVMTKVHKNKHFNNNNKADS